MLPDRGRTADGGRQTGPGTRDTGSGPSGRPGPEDLVTPLVGGNATREGGPARQHGDHGARGFRHPSRQDGQRTIGHRPGSPAKIYPVRAAVAPGQSPAGADHPARALVLTAGHPAGMRVGGMRVGGDAFRRGSVSVAGPGGGRTNPAATGCAAAGRDGCALPPPGRVWPRRPPGQGAGQRGRPAGGSGRLPQRRPCPLRPFTFPPQRVLVGSRYGAATASIRNGCPIRPASLVIDRPRKGVPTRTPADWSRGGPPRARADFIPDARRADVTDVGSGQESSP